MENLVHSTLNVPTLHKPITSLSHCTLLPSFLSLADLPSSRVEASTVAEGPLPTELVARTEQEYMVLGVSPVAITCVSEIVSEKSGEEEEGEKQVTV